MLEKDIQLTGMREQEALERVKLLQSVGDVVTEYAERWESFRSTRKYTKMLKQERYADPYSLCDVHSMKRRTESRNMYADGRL